MTTYKHSPTVGGKDYSQWKLEVKLWQMLTEMDKTRQEIALALSLEGKAQEIAISIDKSLLTTEDGVTNVLTELNQVSFTQKRNFQFRKQEKLHKTRSAVR